MTGYVVLFAASVLLCVAVRVVAIPVPVRREARRSLHPVEIAYLVGGAEHALLVAGLGLHRNGVLRPATTGASPVHMSREEVLQRAASHCVVDDVPTRGHPLEQAVARELRAERQRPVLDEGLLTMPEMTSVREHLISLGLVVDAAKAWWVRFGFLQLAAVAGLGSVLAATSSTSGGRWWLAGALLLAMVAAVLLAVRVPVRWAASRVMERAKAHERETVEVLMRRVDNAGYGTDDRVLRRVGTDPDVVAAHGPEVVWSAEPLLAVALGAIPPKLRSPHEIHADNPLHSTTGWTGW